jgi:Tol biopolymer transport system component
MIKRSAVSIPAALALTICTAVGAPAATDTKAKARRARPIVAVVRTSNAADNGLYTIDPSTGRRIRQVAMGNMRRPFWSPNGKKIVFANGRYLNHIELWIAPAAGGHRRRLTHNDLEDEWPSWAPDSKRLVLERSDDDLEEDAELFVVRVRHTRERNLTDNKADDFCPAWSPDGRRIAFDRSPAFDIFTIRPDGSNARRITSGRGRDGGPIWSPDGSQILFERQIGSGRNAQEALFVTSRSGGDTRRLTGRRIFAGPPYGWSPDGRQVLFTRTNHEYGQADLAIVQSMGGRIHRLHAGVRETNLISPSWAPNGKKIIYAVQHRRNDQTESSDLWTIRPNGSHKRRLTKTSDRVEFHPDWYTHAQECMLSW